MLTVFTGMARPIASARIPASWEVEIDRIARESGRLPSEVVREAIGLYLEKTDGESVQAMGKRLAALERQVSKLMRMV